MKKRIVLFLFVPIILAVTLFAFYSFIIELVSFKISFELYLSYPKAFRNHLIINSILRAFFYLFSSVFYTVFAIRLIKKGNVINEVRYTYEEYKAKRDAEKADREAAQRASRRAELERELAELKKTE